MGVRSMIVVSVDDNTKITSSHVYSTGTLPRSLVIDDVQVHFGEYVDGDVTLRVARGSLERLIAALRAGEAEAVDAARRRSLAESA